MTIGHHSFSGKGANEQGAGTGPNGTLTQHNAVCAKSSSLWKPAHPIVLVWSAAAEGEERARRRRFCRARESRPHLSTRLTLNTQHPTRNTQHPTRNFQHPSERIQRMERHWAGHSPVGSWMFRVGCWAFNFHQSTTRRLSMLDTLPRMPNMA